MGGRLSAQVTPITARGYVSLTVQYRLSGAAKWPAQIDDVKTAIAWTHANAERLAIDPSRVAVVGYSAGGHLAVFAAGVPDAHLAACVAFYPAVELTPALAQVLLPPWKLRRSCASAPPAPSPTSKPGFPPTIIFQGLADALCSPESSLHPAGGASWRRRSLEIHTFAGVPHAFDSHPEFADARAPLTDFFIDQLRL